MIRRLSFVASLLMVLTGALISLSVHDSMAYNEWTNEYRKWPWRAGEDTINRQITTAPNEGEHLNETNTYAIDVGMSYEPVHSIAGGSKVSYQDLYCAGWTLTVADIDGTFIKYKHLNADTVVSGEIVPGQVIATSGNSGAEDNLPPNQLCSSGAHLHFQRDTSATPSTTTDIALEPIGGITDVAATTYPSDNAGVGDYCNATPCLVTSSIDSQHWAVFRSAYTRSYLGHYRYEGPGVTWDPCGQPGSPNGSDKACWWIHYESSGITGLAGAQQDFLNQAWGGAGAIMRRKINSTTFDSTAYWVHGAIWAKYRDFVGQSNSYLGYPLSDEILGSNSASGSSFIKNNFEGGAILFRYGPTWEVHGAIYTAYQNSGGPETSPCGLPTSDEVAGPPGERVSYFERGNISWTWSGGAVMSCGGSPPARPKDPHWLWGQTDQLQWTDNSTTETSFEIWLCGGSSAFATVTSTSTSTTGTVYTRAVTIGNDTKGCYQVRARNASGSSSFTPGAYFVNTIRGSCGSQIPCGHSHSSVRLQMVASKPTETSSTVQYYVWSRGTATAYDVDIFDNIFGAHIDGPWNLGPNVWTGWRSHSTTGTNQLIVFWATCSGCETHWDGVNY